MNMEDVRRETQARLHEVDPELGRDDAEVERQMGDVHRRMIEEAERAGEHYRRIAAEAITPDYRDAYLGMARKHHECADALKALLPEDPSAEVS